MKSLKHRGLQGVAVSLIIMSGCSALAATLLDTLPWSSQAEAPSVLPVDQAFQFSSHSNNGALQLSWYITPAHYLYAERLSLTGAEGVSVEIQKPAGEPYFDEYFGEVEIYREGLELIITLDESVLAAKAPLQWEVRYQGCADRGYCYPPQKRKITVTHGR